MSNEKDEKGCNLIKTFVFRPGEEPVFEMIPATQEAFEQLLDNGWVQHTRIGENFIWVLRNKYAQEDGLPYNRTFTDFSAGASVDLYGTFALVGIMPGKRRIVSINEDTAKSFLFCFKKR